MSWTRSILLFIAVNIGAIILMVLPYYLSMDAPSEVEVATAKWPPT